MVLPQNSDQVFLIDMSVALSGGDRSVSQKLLHHSDVCAVAQEQGRYSMPQHMGSYMSFYLGLPTQLRNSISDSLC